MSLGNFFFLMVRYFFVCQKKRFDLCVDGKKYLALVFM